MTVPSGDTYQAEILRYIHDEHHGELRDTKVGITQRIWEAIGQKGGKNIDSVAASLSHLERRGCIITEFGIKDGGGRARVGVMIVEEPPVGETEYRERQQRRDAGMSRNEADDGVPTAEEIAAALLKLAVQAASTPVSDIEAMRHHITCLQEEVTTWKSLAEELEQAQVTPEALAAAEADLEATKTALLEERGKVDRLGESLGRLRAERDELKQEVAASMQAVRELRHLVQELEGERLRLEEANRILRAAKIPVSPELIMDAATKETLRRLIVDVTKKRAS